MNAKQSNNIKHYNSEEEEINMSPKLTVVRGISGSGKTTLAKEIQKSDLTGRTIHIETDMFHYEDGKYKFDGAKLGIYHKCTQIMVENLLKQGFNVIVSNTSITKEAVKQYTDIADKLDCSYEIICCLNTYENVHNVPNKSVERMQMNFEYLYNEEFYYHNGTIYDNASLNVIRGY